MELARKHLQEAAAVLDNFLTDDHNLEAIRRAAETLQQAMQRGNKILSCGNGGSMSDSMHLAEELTGKFREERRPLPALALGADPAFTSCIANDFGYEAIFARGVAAYGAPGDVLVAFSTSGNSPNVLKAIGEARARSLPIIGLTGKDGGQMTDQCDVEIRAPHHGYADRTQEIHIKVVHILIDSLEHALGLNPPA